MVYNWSVFRLDEVNNVKNFYILILSLFILMVFACETALCEGYGGIVMKYCSIKGQSGLMGGGEGALIVNKNFIFGATGMTLVSGVNASEFDSGNIGNLALSYGGLKVGYIFNPEDVNHFIVHCLFGAGSLGYTNGGTNDRSNIAVIEPGIDNEISVMSIMRICFGVSYRVVTGVLDTPGLSNDYLSNFAVNFTFKWGAF